MPEATSLAHMLGPGNLAHETGRNLESQGLMRQSRPNRADLVTDGEIVEKPNQSGQKKERARDDFDKVLSQKIDGQCEQTLDEHPQREMDAAEPVGENLTEQTNSSVFISENNLLENTDEQIVFEHAVAEIGNPSENTDSPQTAPITGVVVEAGNPPASIAGVVGETETSQSQPNTQPLAQAQGAAVPLPESQNSEGQEKSVPASSTGGTEVPVNEKQAHIPKPATTDGAAAAQGNNDTEGKHSPSPEAMTQTRKPLSSTPESETPQSDQANQDKPIHPGAVVPVQGTRGEQQRDFQSQSDTPTAAGPSQEKTHDIKESKTVPLEAVPVSGEHDGVPKGFEIRNVQSMLHSADPSENASPAALEAPARTGVHAVVPQAETTKPIDQILQHLSSVSVSGPQQRIQLTLTPEHLGTVRITFNRAEDEVVGLLEVQKNQTRREVEQALPQLISAMENSGVQVRRIEIVRWDPGRDGIEDGAANGSDDPAADQFRDESSTHSSESGMFGNPRSFGRGSKSSQFGDVSGQESRIYDAGITEDGLNMFI
ncbi:MAG: flagellar hook-length control protein FliK [Planctomycetota bacterium]|jgi:flagellar hook-length control protein FliK